MTRRQAAFIFDSSAILAYLQGESVGGQVKRIMADASENQTSLFMASINAGEVFYAIARRKSEKEADWAIQMLGDFGIELVAADWRLVRLAASLKARYGAPYVDSFVAALAKLKGGKVVTCDAYFKVLEEEVAICWLDGIH